VSRKARGFLACVDSVAEKSGKAVSLLIMVMMAMTVIEVVARYAFKSPTIWVWPINRQLFAIFVLLGGVYTLRKGGHIRVEMLYNRFPTGMRSVARLIALVCFLVFMGVLVWQGALMARVSIMIGERASGAFRIPIYPFRTFLAVAALLFLLEGIADFVRKKSAGDQ